VVLLRGSNVAAPGAAISDQGSLAIAGGASLAESDVAHVSGAGDLTSQVSVDGATSTWTDTGGMVIGGMGSGALAISDGGTVVAGTDDAVAGLVIGAGAGVPASSVSVTGAASNLTVDGELDVAPGGTGWLDLTAGASVTATALDAATAADAVANVDLTDPG